MSYVFYYSNYCEKCKNIIEMLSKTELKKDIHFICIDKRYVSPQNNATYVILENQQKIVLPPQIQKVPALLLLKEGNNVIFGNQIIEKLNPINDYKNAKASNFNGEPESFALGSDNLGQFGVSSDSYSYWDESSDNMMAKGQAGMRQMYSYAPVEYSNTIETPPDNYTPDKVDENSFKKMEDERNKDLKINMGKPPI